MLSGPKPDRAAVLEKCGPPAEVADDRSEFPELPRLSYTPQPQQVPFHESMAKYRWLRGGLGSGKTVGSLHHLYLYLCTVLWRLPVVVLIGSQTYPHLRDNTVPVLRQVFPAEYLRGGSWETAFNRQEMTLYIGNGSMVLLRTAHHRTYENWRGPQFAAGILNEGRNFPNREPWKVLLGRLRYPGVPEPLLQAWIDSTTNGHDWQWEEFYGKYANASREDFLLLTKDNPHLPAGYYEELEASLDPDDADQELRGAFIARSDQAYRKLSRDFYPLGNALPHDPDPQRATDLGIDWGYRSPRVGLVQELPVMNPRTGAQDFASVIVGEWRMENGGPPKNRTIDDMIEWVLARSAEGWNIRRVLCDPAGNAANDQNHMTSADKLYRALGSRVPIISPKAAWQRSKAAGETTVRARICNAQGDRRLLWSCNLEGELDAPNSFQALERLRFPEKRDNQEERDVSLKDGEWDHDGDWVRYHQHTIYGREKSTRSLQVVAVR